MRSPPTARASLEDASLCRFCFLRFTRRSTTLYAGGLFNVWARCLNLLPVVLPHRHSHEAPLFLLPSPNWFHWSDNMVQPRLHCPGEWRHKAWPPVGLLTECSRSQPLHVGLHYQIIWIRFSFLTWAAGVRITFLMLWERGPEEDFKMSHVWRKRSHTKRVMEMCVKGLKHRRGTVCVCVHDYK